MYLCTICFDPAAVRAAPKEAWAAVWYSANRQLKNTIESFSGCRLTQFSATPVILAVQAEC